MIIKEIIENLKCKSKKEIKDYLKKLKGDIK